MNDEHKTPIAHIADVDPDTIADPLDAKEVSEPEKSVGEPATEKRHWLRRPLLTYLPRSLGGWVFHLLFYMGLGWCLFLAGFWSIIWMVEGASTFSEPPHIVVLQMTGMLAAFLLVVYALFWVPAVAIDRRDERRGSDGLKQL